MSQMRGNRLLSIVLMSWILMIVGCSHKDGTASNSTSNPTKITVVSYGGGAYQQSHVDSFCNPFQTFSSVTVQSVSWNAEYGKLKAMVQDHDASWDVVEVTDAEFK